MTSVICDNCIKCKHTDCVEVCPVECFHEGPNMLVINPMNCSDCVLCVAECPVGAIYSEDDVPAEQHAFIALNEELAKHWPLITHEKSPLPTAKAWAGVANKLLYLRDWDEDGENHRPRSPHRQGSD